MDIIWMVVDVRIVVEVPHPSIYRVECASDPPIIAIVAIKSADVKPVDDPREAGALAECAVKAVWTARAGWGVEGDRLSVAEPHREISNRRLLLFQPRREVAASRNKRVGFVDQVAREGPGEEPLVR